MLTDVSEVRTASIIRAVDVDFAKRAKANLVNTFHSE
jgi:hypothetical protein